MELPEQLEGGKLAGPTRLREPSAKAGTLPPPPDALVLDTSTLMPEQSAQRIVELKQTLR